MIYWNQINLFRYHGQQYRHTHTQQTSHAIHETISGSTMSSLYYSAGLIGVTDLLIK